MTVKQHDIIIVGGGLIGLTLAHALRHTQLDIALCDKHAITPTSKQGDRVYALSATSQTTWQQLGIWNQLATQRVSPYQTMFVWDDNDSIRFTCQSMGVPNLGHIVTHQTIQQALVTHLPPEVSIYSTVQFQQLAPHPHGISLHTHDQQQFTCRLLIGADGGNSWVRRQARMPITVRDYQQHALVATVVTELPHQHTAWQYFTPTGSLAFLPLADPHHCSIVWSTSPEHVYTLMHAAETEFCEHLATAFQQKLGHVRLHSQRFAYPLLMKQAQQYVQPHIALVGDAAHSIHPLAGQGMNLGILDVIALTEVITHQISKQRDFSQYHNLRRYERQRKGHNQLMTASMGGLQRLFLSQRKWVQHLRSLGIRGVNSVPPVKQRLMAMASGQF